MPMPCRLRERSYCHDAYLIALTLAESAPLLTLDTGQQRAAAAMGVQTIALDG